MSFVSIFWYNLNGFLNVENVRQFNFFPAKKAPDDSRGVVNCEQKKHVLLCEMSPASHFFLFEKGEKNYMKSVHSCREETLWQTFCPTSRSRCIFKNSDSCRHKVCDRMRSHRMRSLRHRSQKIECLFTGGYDIRLSYPQIATRKSPLGLGYLRTHPCLQVENTNRSCLVWYLSYLFIYFS